MERLRNMSLKQTFFLLTFGCLFVSLIFVAVCWIVCDVIVGTIPNGGMSIDFSGSVTILEQPSPEQARTLGILRNIQIISCVLFPVLGLGAAGTVFYQWKLKRPIAILREGTERIRKHDLNFSIPEMSKDELGQVCMAFEIMRAELLKSNRELWRQTEERKRLNAAFSHDLRNPITVLKGSVKLLRQGVQNEQVIDRLETYTDRIERYVESMSSIQRLEQMPVQARMVSMSSLCSELKETADLLAPAYHSEIVCLEHGDVLLDHGLFLTVAENLIGNASRFAKQNIQIVLSLHGDFLSLTVSDDGPGYPAALIKDGPQPFGKLDNSPEHFGMGLYSSLLLCQKHGGELNFQNTLGATATAVFQLISKS